MEALERQGALFCVVGPAGSGKTVLGKALLDAFPTSLQQSISVTSRPPRSDEVPGKSYYFVGRQEFQKRIDSGDFFEWEEIHGNLYGTPREGLEAAIANGHDLLLVVDIRGAISIKKAYPRHAVILFLLPPSPEVLRSRMASRGTVDEAEVARRLVTAQSEFSSLLGVGREFVDYVVVNEVKEHASATLESIVRAESVKLSRVRPEAIARICGSGG